MAREDIQAIAARIASSWQGRDPKELEQLIATALTRLETDRSGALPNTGKGADAPKAGADGLPIREGDGRVGPPQRVGQLPDPNSPHAVNPATPSAPRYGSSTFEPQHEPNAITEHSLEQGGLHRDTMGEARAKADRYPPKPSVATGTTVAPGRQVDAPQDKSPQKSPDSKRPNDRPSKGEDPKKPSQKQGASASGQRPSARPGTLGAPLKAPNGIDDNHVDETQGQSSSPTGGAQQATDQPQVVGPKLDVTQPGVVGPSGPTPPVTPSGTAPIDAQGKPTDPAAQPMGKGKKNSKKGVGAKSAVSNPNDPMQQGSGQDRNVDPLTGEVTPMQSPGNLGDPSNPSNIVPGTPVQLQRPPAVLLPPPPPEGEQAVADTRRGMALGMTFVPYNPDDLVAKKGLQIYGQMEKDDQVKACLMLKKCSILGPGWDVEPTDNRNPAAIQLAVEIKEDLYNMQGTFHNALMHMLTAFTYGFSLSEIVFSLPEDINDRIRIKAIKTRAPHDIDFELDPHGNVTALLQQHGHGQQPLMYSKFIHLAYQDEFSNPYGQSDLRACHRAWWLKTNFLAWWAIFAEKLSDPPLVASHPTNAGKPQVDKVLQVLEHMQARTAMTIPEAWKIDLLETKTDPKAMFESAVNHFDLSIARALLVPDKSGYAGVSGSGGTLGATQTQMAAFEMIMEMTARWLEANIQEQLINRLVEYNYGKKVKAPRFIILPLSQANKIQISQLWVAAVNGQTVVPDFDDEQHFRNLLGFPEKNESERVRWEQLEQQKQQLQIMQAMNPNPNPFDKNAKDGEGKLGEKNEKPPPKGEQSQTGKGNPFAAMGGNMAGGHTNPFPGMEKGGQFNSFGGKQPGGGAKKFEEVGEVVGEDAGVVDEVDDDGTGA